MTHVVHIFSYDGMFHWIGLRYDITENTTKWIDGSYLTITSFSMSSLQEKPCVLMSVDVYKTTMWKLDVCSGIHTYVCEQGK